VDAYNGAVRGLQASARKFSTLKRSRIGIRTIKVNSRIPNEVTLIRNLSLNEVPDLLSHIA
jgi:hypothetical protein